MTSADKILRKALVGSGLDTKGWNRVQAGLRDRALFSSQVQDMKFIHGVRENAAAIAAGTKSMSEARRDLRLLLGEIGYDAGENRGTIKDLMTKRRLDVMLKTNVAQAKGYASHLRATTGGALEAFPGYELVRVQERVMKRDWTTRWNAAAAKVGWSGVARGGRKVALKTSPIWAAISAFGNPFPPFDFNSGMGVEDVDRATCVELGLVDDADEAPAQADGNDTSAQPSLNENLFAPVPFEGDTPEYRHLKDVFGDQITHDGGTVRWRGDLIREKFESLKPFEIHLGKPTKALKAKLPESEAKRLKDKSFTVTDDWLDKPRTGGGTHRDHFVPKENDPRNIPLTSGDLELIPTLWRSPDRVTRGGYDGAVVCEADTVDGGVLTMVVDVRDTPKIKTLYKRKSDAGQGASLEHSSAATRMPLSNAPDNANDTTRAARKASAK